MFTCPVYKFRLLFISVTRLAVLASAVISALTSAHVAPRASDHIIARRTVLSAKTYTFRALS